MEVERGEGRHDRLSARDRGRALAFYAWIVRVAWRRSAGVLCALVGVFALSSTPALALRGHVFAGSFGGEGAGNGQLARPAGMAVAQPSGDVYVIDSTNNRVERFSSAGGFLSAFDGHEAPTGAFGFTSEEEEPPVADSGIAIDNSTSEPDPSKGDTYVVDTGHHVIDKFSSTGVYIGQLTKTPGSPFEGLYGVAVDHNGVLWVYRASGEIDSFSNARSNKFLSSRTSAFGESDTHPGFAVDSEDDLYVNRLQSDQEESGPLGKLDSSGKVLIEALDFETTLAAAVDPSTNDVYVDNLTTIAAFSPAGSLLERFGSGYLSAGALNPQTVNEIYGGIAVNPESGDVYVADSGNDKVDIFAPEPPSTPAVHGLFVKNITSTSADLGAQIDPHGAQTNYYFQYGTASCAASPSSCSDVPAPPGALAGSGFDDVSVGVHLENLSPGAYHYRVLAVNELGSTASAERIFTAPRSELVLPDGRAWELVSPPNKNGALISAFEVEGAALQASADGAAMTYGASTAIGEPAGNRSLEWSQILSTRMASGWSSKDIAPPNEVAVGATAGNLSEYKLFSTDLSLGLVEEPGRDETPLSPEASEKTIYLREEPSGEYKPLVTAHNVPLGTKFGQKNRYVHFLGASPDLSHVVLESPEALTSDAGEATRHLYEWVAGGLHAVSVLPGGTLANDPSLGAGSNSENVRHAISNDGTRIVFTDEGKDELHRHERHLYMRDMTHGKTIQLDAAQGVPEPEVSEANFQTANSEGSKVFFTDPQRLTAHSSASGEEEHEKADLYECEVIEGPGGLSCKLSDLTEHPNPGEGADVQGLLPGASEDGSYVYLVASGVLAPGASPGADNLYQLHYNGSEWGTTFIAVLSSEDERDWDGIGHQAQRGGSLDFQLQQLTSRVSPNGRYLAFMSDRPLTGYDNVDAASGRPDEEVFVYDAGSGALHCASCNPSGAPPVGVLDPFRGSNKSRLLVDLPRNWAGRWLAGSIPGWTAVTLGKALNQSRYLTDSGRLLFNSPDALLPQDVNGKEDVYQYEPEGVGGCASASETFSEGSRGCVSLVSSGSSGEESVFLDASDSAGDVFFLTAARLSPQDYDTALDVYDAHECTQAAPCLSPPAAPPPPCVTGESCRAPTSPQPSIFGPPPSATFQGAGNLPPPLPTPAIKHRPLTRAQELSKALKVCRRTPAGRRASKKQKRKRASCEARARRRYRVSTRSKKSSRHTKNGRK